MTNYPEQILTLFDEIIDFASAQSDLKAILLVGSYAYGGFNTDSDIDLVLLTDTPDFYLKDEQWFQKFGISTQTNREDYGKAQSVRVKYNDKEVEYGITKPDWANIEPVDPGTYEVIKKGAKIIYDPENLLKNLLEKMY